MYDVHVRAYYERSSSLDCELKHSFSAISHETHWWTLQRHPTTSVMSLFQFLNKTVFVELFNGFTDYNIADSFSTKTIKTTKTTTTTTTTTYCFPILILPTNKMLKHFTLSCYARNVRVVFHFFSKHSANYRSRKGQRTYETTPIH